MQKLISATFLCFLCFRTAAQEIIIRGQIIDASTNEGVPYGMIFNETSRKQGATANEDGFFKLVMPEGKMDDKISFSSLGYSLRIIQVSELIGQNLKDTLDAKIYTLPDFVFEEKEKQLMAYGDTALSLNNYGGDDLRGVFGFESLGKGYGVFVDPKRKDKGYLKSVSVYITPAGKPYNPMALRILLPIEKMKNARMEYLSNFEDMLTEPVILNPKKTGWNEIDFEALNIPLPEDKFLVILYPLDQGTESAWDYKGNTYYGNVIGIYTDTDVKNLNAARQIGGTRFAFLKPFGINKFHIPAIVINWYKD